EAAPAQAVPTPPPPPPPPPPPEPEPTPDPAASALAEMARETAALAAASPPPAPPVEEPAAERVYSDDTEPDYDEEASSFAYEPPFKPRRNWARIKMIAAILFALAAFGAIAAVAWYGLPGWVPFSRNTVVEGASDLVLDFPANRSDLRT